jgi:hypothetical protein
MLIQRAPTPDPPPDKQTEEFIALMHRLHDAAMQSIAGSYEVTLRAAGTSHMDFSDLPMLGAQTQADAEVRAQVLATIRSLTLAFFGQTLQGIRSPLLEGKSHNEIVQSIRRFN